MKQILLHFFVLIALGVNAQLSCKTKVLGDGSSEKTCLHKNGKVSTKETWDKDQRFGTIVVYSNSGVELFNRSLRKVGGHASAYIEYFTNGQVSKIDFSDAPDGGIQFYNSTTKFDEAGNQTDFYETKYPFELEVQPVEPIFTKKETVTEPKQEETKQEVVECAVIKLNAYNIQNSTSAKVRLRIIAVPNNAVMGVSKEIDLKPNESVNFDTVFTAERHLTDKIYAVEVISFSKQRKTKKLKILEPGPIDQPDGSRVWYWFVVKD